MFPAVIGYGVIRMGQRRLVWLMASLATAALTCGLLAAPAASASSGFIQVENTQTVSPADNVGLISVYIASTSPVATLTVSLYQDGTDVLDLPMSDFVAPSDDGDSEFGPWTLSQPITTGQLPLGVYDVEVTATDTGGDSVSDGVAGTLLFQNEVLFPEFT
jgi:hypothetical protein